MPPKRTSIPRPRMDPSTPQSTTHGHLYLVPQSTTSRKHPSFPKVLSHLRKRLCPLVSTTTGLPHPDFPPTLLSYHLLTSNQLDSLAIHYHQVWPPVPDTAWYPNTITPWIGTPYEKDVDLATKRRRFGRFIGLRGCESPVEDIDWKEYGLGELRREGETEEELTERIEREWEIALLRARLEDEGDAAVLRKCGGDGY